MVAENVSQNGQTHPSTIVPSSDADFYVNNKTSLEEKNICIFFFIYLDDDGEDSCAQFCTKDSPDEKPDKIRAHCQQWCEPLKRILKGEQLLKPGK